MEYLSLQLPGDYQIAPVAGMPSGGVGSVENIISSAVTILITIAVILTIFFLIWGGIQWITSGGDKAKLESARKRLIFALIGLTVVLSSFMIINIFGGVFGIDFF
ncbi:MAG: hypothetical protein A3A51_03735 [Candidatus Levybacteria bacterium RIFCSPLOWO2_01_FULL_39_10]|nr:MAG: hypothetical protein A3A51_03735 [Candidatus Levybacteria bacterium RIFCSPLOWO2_01_FULL_39_10]